MRNVIRTACFLAILGITPAYSIDHIRIHVAEAKEVGEGRLSYLLWDVYDAVLYAPQGFWKEGHPFALQLSYLRQISGDKIADRSVEEMRNQGISDVVKLATWHTQMKNIFPDVDEGVSLTGVYTEAGETVFYRDNTEIGRINDPEFSKAFFGIWLDEKTSAPDLRRKLLGDR
jgi:hypothetical protein